MPSAAAASGVGAATAVSYWNGSAAGVGAAASIALSTAASTGESLGVATVAITAGSTSSISTTRRSYERFFVDASRYSRTCLWRQVTNAVRQVKMTFRAPLSKIASFVPPPEFGIDAALVSWFGLTTNWDTLANRTTNNAAGIASRLNESPVIALIESATNAPVATATAISPDWSIYWSGVGSWLRDEYINPESASFMGDRLLVLDGMLEAEYEGTTAYGTTWVNNIKWRAYSIAKQLGPFVAGWELPLQPDSSGSIYYSFVRDYGSTTIDDPALLSAADIAAKTTPAAISSAIDRVIAVARAAYNELRAISQPATMILGAQSGWISGPAALFPCATKFSASHMWTMSALATRNNGEYLNYIDAFDAVHSNTNTFIEDYTNAPPSNTVVSPYWQWKALKDGQALNPRLIPCVTYKSVIDKAKWAGSYNDPETLRAWFLLNMFCCFHWFGFSFFGIYAGIVPASDLSQSLWNNDPYTTTPGWSAVSIKFNPAVYDVVLYSSYLPAKDYTGFADPASWAVYFPAALVTVASGNPFPGYWTRVAFPGGIVTMTSGGRNIVYRPVYLRALVSHTVTVDFQFAVLGTGSGKVKLRVRGYDKLDGLANTETEVIDSDVLSVAPLWKHVSVSVIPRLHTVTRLPNPNYILIAIDHNGIGNCSFRNPSIAITVPQPPSPFSFPPIMDSGIASSVDTFDIDSGSSADNPIYTLDGNE